MLRRRSRILAGALIVAAALMPVGAEADPGTRDPDGARYCPAKGEERFDTRRLKGRRLFKARRISNRHECDLRIVKRGDTWLPHTDDFRFDRVNVGVRDGRVSKVYGVY